MLKPIFTSVHLVVHYMSVNIPLMHGYVKYLVNEHYTWYQSVVNTAVYLQDPGTAQNFLTISDCELPQNKCGPWCWFCEVKMISNLAQSHQISCAVFMFLSIFLKCYFHESMHYSYYCHSINFNMWHYFVPVLVSLKYYHKSRGWRCAIQCTVQ
jgi:hypothetical protein